jgi:S-adenosylmethionine synthetase
MSLEAAAGKNPVTHVGKLYNIVASRIAEAVVDRVPGAIEAQCCLISRIGYPIDEPHLADLKVRLDEPQRIETLRAQCVSIVRDQLGEIGTLWRETVDGRIALW